MGNSDFVQFEKQLKTIREEMIQCIKTKLADLGGYVMFEKENRPYAAVLYDSPHAFEFESIGIKDGDVVLKEYNFWEYGELISIWDVAIEYLESIYYSF